MSDDLTRHLREEEIVPFLEGKLPAEGRAQFESHLAECRACREHLTELRAVMEELNDWVAVEPSGAFDAAVRERIGSEKTPSVGGLGWLLRPGWGVALTLALLAGGAIGVWRLAPGDSAPDVADVIVADDVDAVFGAALDDEEMAALEDQQWTADYELIQEFDALFEDGENGSSQL